MSSVRAPIVIAFLVGLLSLSQEVLWTRLVSFSYQTKPHAFSFVLATYLLGVAIGAVIGRNVCKGRRDLLATSGIVLIVSAMLDAAAPWIYAAGRDNQFSVLLLGILIASTAAAKSVLFPLVHHMGADSAFRKGAAFSQVYVGNVAGAALGPLLAGLILLEHASLQASFFLVASLTALTGLYALSVGGASPAGRAVSLALSISTLGLLLAPNTLSVVLSADDQSGAVTNVIENRAGIIHTRAGGENGDVVYGMNVYDGRINTSLERPGNAIYRAYALAAMHESPMSVLVIGLSSGSWVSVLSRLPSVQRMDVVEINSGYLDLVSRYEEVSHILSDARISYHIDDGRRWLRAQHNAKYDLIVLNSIHHWRSGATNLLSREFMELSRTRLNPGGVFYVNATGSPDVLATASGVFDFAYRYANFVVGTDAPLDFELKSRREVFRQMKHPDGAAMFDLSDSAHLAALDNIFRTPIEGLDEVKAEASRSLEVIRDDNMVTEYRYGSGFL